MRLRRLKIDINRYCEKVEVITMIDLLARFRWTEKEGFSLKRDNIGPQYIFLHFLTPVKAVLKDKTVDIKPGGCVIFAPYSKQIFFSSERDLVHDWFHIGPEFEKSLSKYSIETEKVYYPSPSDNITELVRKLDSLQAITVPFIGSPKFISDETLIIERIYCVLDEILIELATSIITENTATGDKQHSIVANARLEILSNYSEEWNIQKMSDLVRLSPSRFQHVYKDIFGISPVKDLENRRISEAKLLLLKTDYTVETISSMVGYDSQTHFIRQFKKSCGISPGKFRTDNRA